MECQRCGEVPADAEKLKPGSAYLRRSQRENTTRPAAMVCRTRPQNRLPRNGEFFDFDFDTSAVNIHSSSASKITTSAAAPTRSTPASFHPINAAGFVESQRTARLA